MITGATPHRLVVKLVILAAVAIAATVLIALGFEYRRQALSPQVTVGEPAATNPLELSVFDQPRDAPEIRFLDEHGQDLSLADFRGRVVLLNVWATWCVPCRREMPALDRLQAKLGGNEFLVIPLSVDREGVAAVKRFYQDLGLQKLEIYADPSGKGSRALAIPGVPTTLLIDRQGREIARKMGAAEWDAPEMVARIERTIHGQSVSEGNGGR